MGKCVREKSGSDYGARLLQTLFAYNLFSFLSCSWQEDCSATNPSAFTRRGPSGVVLVLKTGLVREQSVQIGGGCCCVYVSRLEGRSGEGTHIGETVIPGDGEMRH